MVAISTGVPGHISNSASTGYIIITGTTCYSIGTDSTGYISLHVVLAISSGILMVTVISTGSTAYIVGNSVLAIFL